MKIAVLADTHNRLRAPFPDILEDADEIWHLGDVCEPSLLDVLRSLGKPVTVVRGNCDSCMEWPLTLTLSRAGIQFLLTHIPPDHAVEGCDVVLHGHTHVPRDEIIDGVRHLNPGCITRPNRGAPPSFAWLEIDGKSKLHWTLVRLPPG